MSEVNIENKDEQNSTPEVEENTWVSRVAPIETPNEVLVEEPKVEEVVVEESKNDIITTPNPISETEPTHTSLGNDIESGAFATKTEKPVKKTASSKEKKSTKDEDVVIFSSKNLWIKLRS